MAPWFERRFDALSLKLPRINDLHARGNKGRDIARGDRESRNGRDRGNLTISYAYSPAASTSPGHDLGISDRRNLIERQYAPAKQSRQEPIQF